MNALKITSRVFVNDDASPWAGCTTAPVRTPVGRTGQGLALGKLGRRAPEAADHGAPSEAVVVAVINGRLDFGTWERILCQPNG